MASWSAVARSGETIACPPTGQTIRFLQTGAETDGEYARVAITIAADATRRNSVTHVHPHQTETIAVQSGVLGVAKNGNRGTLYPGESVTFEPGDAHAFWNAGDGELAVETELRPAMQAELFIRFTYGLSQVGRVSPSGIPLNPLRLGLLMDEFEGHVYLAGLPIPIQKFGARVLGPLARAAGYSLDLDEGYERA
ncbi:cupin domain-containing protein [Haloarcula sp. S1CR25-12]|uniref:Cupin domain-containing protein n=1 Tax=Haloarcula saliterrae TaxID=2950534 RepID=A0ABU2FEQ8_9EURY|nr:cupin domain-containing protein [Haloarcula sp. S1CR25-12]MDS0260745.1 cupin domain-containing protein [Haloarcula sp. S1CR25-12]